MLKIAVPFPPGGSMDTIARLLGEQINKAYDPTVVIENCPGGGAAIASTTKVTTTRRTVTLEPEAVSEPIRN